MIYDQADHEEDQQSQENDDHPEVVGLVEPEELLVLLDVHPD